MTTIPTRTLEDLATPEGIANPFPIFHQLREQSPLQYLLEKPNTIAGRRAPVYTWALLRFDDVHQAVRDHATFSSARPPSAEKAVPKLVLIQDDPPHHTHFRRIVQKTFNHQRIVALEPWITRVAHELLDRIGTEQVDIIEAFATPLPVTVIARILGIPGEQYHNFKRWSDAFLAFTSMPGEERIRSNQEMMEYFGRMLAARRKQGADDLLTELVKAEIEGEKLQDWEILSFCALLLIAGNETTTHLIGNMLGILVERPHMWQRLRDNRDLIAPCIEETLRYESPIQRVPRHTTRDVEIANMTIPAGSAVSIYYGAANRDPAMFPEPDEFRLDRDPYPHLALGSGIHHCLGAALARAEARIMLNAFLDRFPTIQRGRAEAVRQQASPVVFGYQQLPLVLKTY